MTIPYPDDAEGDEYLRLVGRLVYAVGYLEWGVLGDLARHATVVPSALSVAELAGQTTGTIAERIRQQVSAVTDPAVAAWLRAGSEHLDRAAKIRNPVLHARPTTVGDAQRLHRWKAADRRGGAESLTITVQVLRDGIAEIERRGRDLGQLRPA
jgi:hypothetical protein